VPCRPWARLPRGPRWASIGYVRTFRLRCPARRSVFSGLLGQGWFLTADVPGRIHGQHPVDERVVLLMNRPASSLGTSPSWAKTSGPTECRPRGNSVPGR
jgi:hypothetical protein